MVWMVQQLVMVHMVGVQRKVHYVGQVANHHLNPIIHNALQLVR
jgi:hypothetical protein